MAPTGEVRIGISGWRYAGWRGVFYPPGLAQRRELEYASRRFSAIELNGSFYSLQWPSSYRTWAEQTPDDFVFAVKGSRFITHMLKLRGVGPALANFLASGVLLLGGKLGPFLWQFPEQLRYDRERFEGFLEMLPRTAADAARLARGHTIPRPERSWTEAQHDAQLRHAFEVRHPSFFESDFVELLRSRGAGLVIADTAGIWPYFEDLTADVVYIRLHGAEQLYASGYTDAQLDEWARRIRAWRAGMQPRDAVLSGPVVPGALSRDVYVFFDNDAKVHAPFDAIRLRERLDGVEKASDQAA
jgi:uncharacterized protein YecE (DUF72 family)